MCATVVCVGGLFFYAVLLVPTLDSIPLEAHPALMEKLRRRFQPLAWLSLAILFATGLTQMTGSPHYEGVLVIRNTWSTAILTKHIIIFTMVVIAGYQTVILQRQMIRIALQRTRSSSDEPDIASILIKRQVKLMRLNLALSLVALSLTAIARTA